MAKFSTKALCLVAGGLLAFAAPDAQALNIIRNFVPGAAPVNGVGGGNLQAIFNAAADWWEIAIQDSHTLTLAYGWAPLGGSTLGQHNLLGQIGGRETFGTITFDNDGSSVLFLDPTPRLNEEYSTFTASSSNLGGVTVNTGRVFTGASGAALGAIDLFTVALHEIGHALGLSSANTSYRNEAWPDNDIDIVGGPFNGAVLPTNNTGTSPAPPAPTTPGFSSNAHLNIGNALLFPSVGASFRRYGTEADILANAQLSSFTNLNLNPDFGGAVPEPGTYALFGLGLLGLGVVRRRRRKVA